MGNLVGDLPEYMAKVTFTADEDAWTKRLQNVLRLDPNANRHFEAAVRRFAPVTGGTTAAVVHITRDMHSRAAWVHWGSNVFELTHGLVTLLMLTTVDETLELPFPCFDIRIPPGLLPARSHGHFIVGVRFTQRKAPAKHDCTIDLGVGGTRPAKFDIASADPDVRAVSHLVSGLCSFLTSKVEPLEQTNKRDTRRSAPEKAGAPKVFTVGRTVKISRELRDAVANRGTEPLWKLEHRHVVRGHWRNQPVGPGRVERRKTWVQPYWKGPDGAEAWQHVYNATTASSAGDDEATGGGSHDGRAVRQNQD